MMKPTSNDEREPGSLHRILSLPVGDVLAIINEWRSHYPEDIFPRTGPSPECKAAYMARHVCDGIAGDVVRQAKTDTKL